MRISLTWLNPGLDAVALMASLISTMAASSEDGVVDEDVEPYEVVREEEAEEAGEVAWATEEPCLRLALELLLPLLLAAAVAMVAAQRKANFGCDPSALPFVGDGANDDDGGDGGDGFLLPTVPVQRCRGRRDGTFTDRA
jgi:hypothetical protein